MMIDKSATWSLDLASAIRLCVIGLAFSECHSLSHRRLFFERHGAEDFGERLREEDGFEFEGAGLGTVTYWMTIKYVRIIPYDIGVICVKWNLLAFRVDGVDDAFRLGLCRS